MIPHLIYLCRFNQTYKLESKKVAETFNVDELGKVIHPFLKKCIEKGGLIQGRPSFLF